MIVTSIRIGYEEATGTKYWKIQAKVIAQTIPPTKPSTVLFGDISGHSFRFPIFLPVNVSARIRHPNDNKRIDNIMDAEHSCFN